MQYYGRKHFVLNVFATAMFFYKNYFSRYYCYLFVLVISFTFIQARANEDLDKKIEKVNTALIQFIYYFEKRFSQIEQEIGQIEYNVSACQFEKFAIDLHHLQYQVQQLRGS